MTTPADPASRPAPVGDERRGLEGWGTPALVLGVIAIGTIPAYLLGSTSWTPYVGAVAGLAAVVVGLVGTVKGFNDPTRSGGAALAGLALGLVALVWAIVVLVQTFFPSGTFGTGLSLDECMQQAQGQQQQRICATQHLDEYRARFPNRQNI